MIRRFHASKQRPRHMLYKPVEGKWCRYADVEKEMKLWNTIEGRNQDALKDQIATLQAINGELQRRLSEYDDNFEAL